KPLHTAGASMERGTVVGAPFSYKEGCAAPQNEGGREGGGGETLWDFCPVNGSLRNTKSLRMCSVTSMPRSSSAEQRSFVSKGAKRISVLRATVRRLAETPGPAGPSWSDG